MSAITNLFRLLKVIPTHAFGSTPVSPVLFADKNSIAIAIIGDWGTGNWADGSHDSPAVLVADAIKHLEKPPDIIIHLGDVYYSGLAKEEQDCFLNGFPAAADNYNFTMNSNHEMYDGANGYFDVALKSPLFSRQNETSYFALSFKEWVIVALDSAYFDTSFMIKKGALTNGNTFQKDFIKSLQLRPDQKLVLLTHHPALDYSGAIVNQPLVDQVHDALGGIYPDYWYYGHIHNGIVYTEQSAMGGPGFNTRSGTYPRLRCIGHSAIPFGAATLRPSRVSYYAHTPMPNPSVKQVKRVLNGFAVVTLSAGNISETIYEVSPAAAPNPVWQG